jgi:DNA transformation protein and related proteins
MPQKSNPYLEFLAEQMAPLGEITWRSMFGGYCLYCDGIVFALIANQCVFLKANDEDRGKFEARGLQAFRPFEGSQSMSYYEAPPEIFEDPDAMKHWCGGAVEAGRLAQSKKKPKKTKVNPQ